MPQRTHRRTATSPCPAAGRPFLSRGASLLSRRTAGESDVSLLAGAARGVLTRLGLLQGHSDTLVFLKLRELTFHVSIHRPSGIGFCIQCEAGVKVHVLPAGYAGWLGLQGQGQPLSATLPALCHPATAYGPHVAPLRSTAQTTACPPRQSLVLSLLGFGNWSRQLVEKAPARSPASPLACLCVAPVCPCGQHPQKASCRYRPPPR